MPLTKTSRAENLAMPSTLLVIGFLLLLTAVSAGASSNGPKRWGKDYFPNIRLVTHEGKAVHFFDDLIRDKVV
ncbi:MAG: electron transporter SenC, partial [Myxococcota bacterium]